MPRTASGIVRKLVPQLAESYQTAETPREKHETDRAFESLASMPDLRTQSREELRMAYLAKTGRAPPAPSQASNYQQ